MCWGVTTPLKLSKTTGDATSPGTDLLLDIEHLWAEYNRTRLYDQNVLKVWGCAGMDTVDQTQSRPMGTRVIRYQLGLGGRVGLLV